MQVDYDNETELVEALRGQDFLIITMASRAPSDVQSKLIKAAVKAGIKYVMPNVFGLDYTNESLINDIPVAADRTVKVHKEIEETGVLSWINIVCGFWYQHSLVLCEESFGFNFKERRVTFFDDGNTKINISTLPQCGRAVAALLSLKIYPDNESDESPTLSRWLNQSISISSFLINQKEMFESWKRITGEKDSDWTVEYEPTRQRYERGFERMKQGDHVGWAQILYTRMFFPNGGGNHEEKLGLDNEVLGLPVEDLDEQTLLAKEALESGYSYHTYTGSRR